MFIVFFTFWYLFPIPLFPARLYTFFLSNDYTKERGVIMIKITFCFKLDSELNFMETEVTQCFHQRGVSISTQCCHNTNELKQSIKTNCPDILFCDLNENKNMYNIILYMKKLNPNLVCLTTEKSDCCLSENNNIIEPFFTIPNKSRKQLWTYASLAYEATINDDTAFAYYRRPGYIYTPVDNIWYFASEGRRTCLFTDDGCDSFYKKLDEVEQLVRNKCCQFLRIHKSFLVNIKYISGYNRKYVKLSNGERLRISNYSYYKKINQSLDMKPTHQYIG